MVRGRILELGPELSPDRPVIRTRHRTPGAGVPSVTRSTASGSQPGRYRLTVRWVQAACPCAGRGEVTAKVTALARVTACLATTTRGRTSVRQFGRT